MNEYSALAVRTVATITQKQRQLLEKEMSRLPAGSIYFKKTRGHFNFYHYNNRIEICINSNPNLIYKLARKKYISLILHGGSEEQIINFLNRCVEAKLILNRITLSPKQFKWVTAEYSTNPNYRENCIYSTPSGIKMRSKSERDIGTELESCGIPFRYEMTIRVYVGRIVEGLIEYLNKTGYLSGKRDTLFSYCNGRCIWNVPDELSWMNAKGSIWQTYDRRSGTLVLNVDFAVLLGDGSVLIWEHAGLCLNPIYRNNISERIFVLRTSGYSDESHLIFTVEEDIHDINEIRRIIVERILPLV